MLNQAVLPVQPDPDTDGLSVNLLPPLNNLPQWSRINTLDKARYPKTFPKDRLPLPATKGDNEGPPGVDLPPPPGGEGASAGDADSPPVAPPRRVGGSEGTLRIQHLEKSILFLQVQHKDVLANLHEEIEKLKRENKELQFKVIMVQKSSPPGTCASRVGSVRRQSKPAEQADSARTRPEQADSARTRGEQADKEQGPESASSAHTAKADDDARTLEPLDAQSAGTDSKLEELRSLFLEEELRDLRRQLKEEKARNSYLGHLLHQSEKQKLQTQQQNLLEDQAQNASTPGGMAGPRGGVVGVVTGQLPFNASMVPLQVRLPNKNPRPPTLAECEVIIRHLQNTNDKQAHELNQLKTDLRDVLYSHKWTPDAYLLAKAYVAEDDARESTQLGSRLPRIPLRQQARKLPSGAYIQRDSVTLPALKQTMGNKAIERRKRTQVLQRSRIGREVLP